MAARRKKQEPQPEEFDWRGFVNALEVGPFAEQGDDEPPTEVEEEEEIQLGRYTKLTFEVNLFTSETHDKCFMIYSTQRMFDYGAMTIAEALAKAKGRRRS